MDRPLVYGIVITCFLACNVCTQKSPEEPLSLVPVDIHSEHIIVSDKTWLQTVAPYFTVDGQRHSLEGGTLKYLGNSTQSGRDVHGIWRATVKHYSAGGVPIDVAIRQYKNQPFVIFEQTFPDGANQTASGSPNFALSGFPRFVVGGQSDGLDLGYLNYGGMFVGDTTKWMGRWMNSTYSIRDGVAGGPIVLFSRHGQALIISAYNQFMTAVTQHEAVTGGVLSYGIMGSVLDLPAGFSMQTVIFYSALGINHAFEGWGRMLRAQYNRHDSYVKSDFAVNYLGYWTDNGAYYYYVTEKNMTYDQTIYAVQKYARNCGIPYRYVQYDSWWYHMGPLGGVARWETRPTVFTEGMSAVYNKTEWPVVAHNRWWSAWTPYAKKNGGRFNFLADKFKSVPMDLDFWDWLFKLSKKWGLITYEQDWLDAQLLGIQGLLTDVYSARRWLLLMGSAAQENDINIQYCMSFSRHALQTLEIPTVTQIRVTDDYQPGENDWKLGVSSIFAHALRLSPYKDTFWTTKEQPGNPYGLSEAHPALHAVAAVLSTGPVGPGDRIGYTNVSLLMRCCNSDGLILKPDKPVTAIDDQIIEAAFRDGSGAPGQVWTTYSEVSGWRFGIILAADMTSSESYYISPRSAGFTDNFSVSRVFASHPRLLIKAVHFDEQNKLKLAGCTKLDFCVHHTTPIMTIRDQELLLYGEISKWVPMSSKRVQSIEITSDDVTIILRGAVKEKVSFWFSVAGRFSSVTCILSQSGSAVISIMNKLCYSL